MRHCPFLTDPKPDPSPQAVSASFNPRWPHLLLSPNYLLSSPGQSDELPPNLDRSRPLKAADPSHLDRFPISHENKQKDPRATTAHAPDATLQNKIDKK